MDHRDRFRRALLATAAMVAVLLPAAPAAAHTELLSTTPAKGATVTKAPAAVALKFSQSPNPDFTQIVVSDAAKKQVPASRPAVDKGTAKVTFTTPLTNGVYTVAYRVVSNDGHTVKGNYTFTVADPAQTATTPPAEPSSAPATTASSTAAAPVPAAATATATATATAESSSDDGDGDGGMPAAALIAIGGVIAIAAAGGVLFALRRKRPEA